MENEPTINGRTLVALMALSLALACLFVSLVATAPQLPPRVASHFGGAGVPDGWMDRGSYLLFMGLFAVGMALLVIGAFYSIRYLPTWMINLPNRDYWLAPERRPETCATMLRYGVWLATLQAVLLMGVHLLVVRANNAQPVAMPPAVWLLSAAFLLATGVWAYSLFQRFRLPA